MRPTLSPTLCALGCCVLLAVVQPALAQKGAASVEKRPAVSGSKEKPPLEMLPRWAVPQSYQLELRSDPQKNDYSGTVTIAVDLKKSSDHLWLHGRDFKVSKVTLTDAGGRAHQGKYTEAAPEQGVARIDFGGVLQAQKLKLAIVFSAPYNQTLEGYYKVSFAGSSMPSVEPASTSGVAGSSLPYCTQSTRPISLRLASITFMPS